MLQLTDEYCLPKKPLNTKYTFKTGCRKISVCRQSHNFVVNKFVLLQLTYAVSQRAVICKEFRLRCVCKLLFQPAEELLRCSQMVFLQIPLQLSDFFAAPTCSYGSLSCPLHSEFLSLSGGPLLSTLPVTMLFACICWIIKILFCPQKIIKLRTITRNVYLEEQGKCQRKNVSVQHMLHCV